MITDREFFINTLDTTRIHGVKRRYWIKMLYTQPDKVATLFFQKLDREYANQRHWEIAKILLLKNHPHLAGDPEPEERNSVPSVPHQRCELPEPEPVVIVYNLDYFLSINGGRWGDAMVDIDEYEQEYGLIL